MIFTGIKSYKHNYKYKDTKTININFLILKDGQSFAKIYVKLNYGF